MTTQYPAKKNAAFTAVFPILDADGDLVTGAAGLDSEISKDGGTFADCTNESAEIATASGVYKLTLTATEMNADIIAVIVKSSTEGAKTTVLVFYTSAQTLDELDAIADGIKEKTDLIGTSVAPSGEYDTQMGTGERASATALSTAQTDLDNPTQYKATGFSVHSAADVWAVATRTLTSFGTLAQDIWDVLTSALTTVGSIGKLLVDNVNATISSRAPSGEYDTQMGTGERASATALATAQADLDTPAQYKADVSALALEATLTAMKGMGWTAESLKGITDAIAALNNLADSEVWAYVTRTLTDPDSYKADVSAVALEATLTAMKGTGWTNESLKGIQDLATALEKIGTNRWKIVSNQLIIYDDDGVTPLYTFDLKDEAGDPATENVYERVIA